MDSLEKGTEFMHWQKVDSKIKLKIRRPVHGIFEQGNHFLVVHSL